MKPVTKWFHQPTPEFEMAFNHLEDGHSQECGPKAHTPEQAKQWKGGRWERVHAWLTDSMPARVVHYTPEEA